MKIREIFETILTSVSDSEFVLKAKNYYNKGDQQGLINHINELQRKSKAINNKELDQHLAELKLEVIENFHDEDDIELLIDMLDEFLNRKQPLNAEAGGGGGGGAGGGGAGGGGAGGGGAAGGTGGTGGATGGTSSGGDGGSADSGGTSDSGTTSSDSTSSDAPVSRGYAFLGSMVPGKKYKKKKKNKKGYDFGKGVY